jgi:hypothetical protein
MKSQKIAEVFAKLLNFLVGLADKPRQDLATVQLSSQIASKLVIPRQGPWPSVCCVQLKYSTIPDCYYSSLF